MLIEALGTARDLGRLHEIASVLIRHGLGDLVRRVGLARVLETAGRALHWEAAQEVGSKLPPQRLREALETLGPTFVKLGQVLSGRSDLLPPQWTDELARLQEDVAAVPLDELLPQLVEDLGAPPEEVFARFDREPLAAASIAQVHRAATREGIEVALKIRRPGIEEVVEADLRLLARLAELLEQEAPELRRYRPRALARQFAHSMRAELDFSSEARNAQRIAERMPADFGVVVPAVHGAWTRERLCVMDYLDGISLGEWLELPDRDPEEGRRIARTGADAVLHMIFVSGLYHADPHPGNVVLLADGRLGLLDFGMVGRLSETRRIELVSLLAAVVERREDDLVDLLLSWSEEGDPDVTALTAECVAFVDRYHGATLRQIDVTRLLLDVTELLRENDLSLPSDVAMLLKVFVTLDGLGRALDPDFELAAHVEPFVERAMRTWASPLATLRRGAGDLARVLAGLPRDLRRLSQSARRGRFGIDVDVRTLEDFGRQIDKSVNRLTIGLVTSALIVGTAIAMTVTGGPELLGLPAFGLLGFASSMLVGLWLVFAILRAPRR